MKGLIHKIDVPIYGQRVYLSFCKDTLMKKFNISMRNDDCDGFTVQVVNAKDDQVAFVMYIEKNEHDCICVSTTAHECYHVADMIFEKCGVEYKDDSGNEHMAYLLDWLVKETFLCLERNSEYEQRALGGSYEY